MARRDASGGARSSPGGRGRAFAETAAGDADAAEEVATLAETAAKAAEAAAAKAGATGDRMHGVATAARGKGRQDAAAAVAETGDQETSARERYQEAERKVGSRARASQDAAPPAAAQSS